jgi:site-specific DNA recombinase
MDSGEIGSDSNVCRARFKASCRLKARRLRRREPIDVNGVSTFHRLFRYLAPASTSDRLPERLPGISEHLHLSMVPVAVAPPVICDDIAWVSTVGRRWGGKPLARGALYLMLRNRIYRGEIVHKDQYYPGEHEPIIDEPLWEEVQAKLAANAVERATGERIANPSLLAGLLYDGQGHRMTPSHAVKKGMRYRYYVSQSLISRTRKAAPEGLRIAAAEIEQVVTSEIHRLLRHPSRISALMASHLCSAADQSRALHGATEFAARWSNLSVAERRAIVTRLIPRIVVRDAEVELCLSPGALAALLCKEPEVRSADEDLVALSVPARLQRAGHGVALIIDAPERDGRAAKPDPKLIKLIARAHRLRDRLLASGEAFLIQLAKGEQLNRSYFTRIVQLSYLAPDITQAILDGRQPRGLTARTLLTRYLPVSWAEQRIALGFARPEAEPVEATL